MIEVRSTQRFSLWLDALRDARARTRILVRLKRMEMGNSGDTRAIGSGLWEMRIDYGPGYRIYYRVLDQRVVLLLGGTKATQSRDIQLAQKMTVRPEFDP